MTTATVRDAAQHFGVTTRTISNWIAGGYLAAERIGPRKIWVDLDSIHREPIEVGR